MTATMEERATTVVAFGPTFVERIKAVLPHAGVDPMLPVLTNVRIANEGGAVCAEATDRFTLARAELDTEGSVPDDFDVLIPAKLLAAAIKGRDAKRYGVTITVDGPRVTIQVITGAAHTDLIGEGDFPKLRTLLKDTSARETTPADRIALYPNLMRKYAPATLPRNATIVFRPTGTNGMTLHVTLSDEPWYAGVAMARRA